MNFSIDPHYCIPCLDKGNWVVTTIEVPITQYTSWPMCMSHMMMWYMDKVVCV